jgi:anaerobic selenocysteine-containing dehydrogenase
MFNYVRLSDGGPRRYPGPRSEVQVVADLGKRLVGEGKGVEWDAMAKTHSIRHWIAKVVPGYEAIDGIEKTKKEFQIEGRTFHEPRFGTKDGLAVLHRPDLPPLQGNAPGEFRLMTVRSEGQFNTVVYEEYDLYRGQDRRDIILLNPEDIARHGWQEGQRVTVRNETGQMPNIMVRSYPAIRSGNALMYYPEANVLVPRKLDPLSKTPVFKGVVVTIDAQ